MLAKLIMWLCHIKYKKFGFPIFYIRGTGEDYPKYLIYTENENVYRNMDKI